MLKSVNELDKSSLISQFIHSIFTKHHLNFFSSFKMDVDYVNLSNNNNNNVSNSSVSFALTGCSLPSSMELEMTKMVVENNDYLKNDNQIKESRVMISSTRSVFDKDNHVLNGLNELSRKRDIQNNISNLNIDDFGLAIERLLYTSMMETSTASNNFSNKDLFVQRFLRALSIREENDEIERFKLSFIRYISNYRTNTTKEKKKNNLVFNSASDTTLPVINHHVQIEDITDIQNPKMLINDLPFLHQFKVKESCTNLLAIKDTPSSASNILEEKLWKDIPNQDEFNEFVEGVRERILHFDTMLENVSDTIGDSFRDIMEYHHQMLQPFKLSSFNHMDENSNQFSYLQSKVFTSMEDELVLPSPLAQLKSKLVPRNASIFQRERVKNQTFKEYAREKRQSERNEEITQPAKQILTESSKLSKRRRLSFSLNEEEQKGQQQLGINETTSATKEKTLQSNVMKEATNTNNSDNKTNEPLNPITKESPYQSSIKKIIQENFTLSFEDTPVPGLVKAKLVKLIRGLQVNNEIDDLVMQKIKSLVFLHVTSCMKALENKKDNQEALFNVIIQNNLYKFFLTDEYLKLFKEKWESHVKQREQHVQIFETPSPSNRKANQSNLKESKSYLETIKTTSNLLAIVMIDEYQVCNNKTLLSISRQLESDAFNMKLIERELSPSGSVLSFIFDERSACIFATSKIALSETWIEQKMKWVAEKASMCFRNIVILIQSEEDNKNFLLSLGKVEQECLKKLSLACFLLKPKITVTLRFTTNVSESAKMIRSLCDMFAHDSSIQVNAPAITVWFERGWIPTKESTQERFLSRAVPFFNSFVSCEILNSQFFGPSLNEFLSLSSKSTKPWEDEIAEMYPWISKEIFKSTKLYLSKDLSPIPIYSLQQQQQQPESLSNSVDNSTSKGNEHTPSPKRFRREKAKRYLSLDASHVHAGGQTKLQWSNQKLQ